MASLMRHLSGPLLASSDTSGGAAVRVLSGCGEHLPSLDFKQRRSPSITRAGLMQAGGSLKDRLGGFWRGRGSASGR